MFYLDKNTDKDDNAPVRHWDGGCQAWGRTVQNNEDEEQKTGVHGYDNLLMSISWHQR